MTQRQRVLQMLKDAGPRGIRSDAFIKDFMPRAAARVKELREEGYEISSEREGKYTRWTLTNVGVGAEDSESVSGLSRSGLASQSAISTDSGVAASSSSPVPASEAPPVNPYEYEVWAA